jgi:hypothetical protein
MYNKPNINPLDFRIYNNISNSIFKDASASLSVGVARLIMIERNGIV